MRTAVLHSSNFFYYFMDIVFKKIIFTIFKFFSTPRFIQFPSESILWEDIQNLTVALEGNELDPSREFLKGKPNLYLEQDIHRHSDGQTFRQRETDRQTNIT